MSNSAREEHAVLLSEWPRPAVPSEPQVTADDTALRIRYKTAEGKTAIIWFPLYSYLIVGQPNDEALSGHPLWGRGLNCYSVHEVIDSSLIRMLEQRNAVHPRHDRKRFLEYKRHYVFTFQDSTLECVVTEGDWWKPTIRVYSSEEEADRAWLQRRPPGP